MINQATIDLMQATMQATENVDTALKDFADAFRASIVDALNEKSVEIDETLLQFLIDATVMSMLVAHIGQDAENVSDLSARYVRQLLHGEA